MSVEEETPDTSGDEAPDTSEGQIPPFTPNPDPQESPRTYPGTEYTEGPEAPAEEDT